MSHPPHKVLIVSPHFAPINAPDMQRTRIALPYLRSFGWEPVVLSVAPDLVEGGVVEPLLEETYPSDIRIVRVRGIPQRITRLFGIGSLWLRCGASIRAAGERLLSEERIDLVLFSTTQFDCFTLGPRWKARFGVPYVLDYQDPWINDYYHRTNTKPPGGWLKFGISQWSARLREPRALRGASAVITVSDAYGKSFAERYPWFIPSKVALLPFGAASADIATAQKHKPSSPLVPFGDEYFHIVYTGRCGPDMSTSLSVIFLAFKNFLAARPDEAKRIRFHFIGTDYAPRPFGRTWALPIAKALGVEAFVSEHCYRVPYFDALYYLVNADALVCVGSNDPTYSASKLYPYVMAARPMLVVFHYLSQVTEIANRLKCGSRYQFHDSGDIPKLADAVTKEWFMGGGMTRFVEPDFQEFSRYTAGGMTRSLAKTFDLAVGNQSNEQ